MSPHAVPPPFQGGAGGGSPAASPLWTAQELQHATSGHMPHPFAATGISIDTRTLTPGDLFIALEAETDGHAHTQAALDKGAAGVLIHNDTLPAAASTLRVGNTQHALEALGRAARARFEGQVVAITGSVGKTTTKEMLRTVLHAFAPTHAAHASYNNHWGVPLTLARIPRDARYAIAEIGMNNPGEILPLACLAAPHVAVITTVGTAHIGHLGSLGAIAEEKATLLDGLVSGGTAILPADSPQFDLLAAHAPGPILTFGRAPHADVRLTALDLDTATIEASVAGTPVRFRLQAPGTHMAMNALACLAAAHALGLDAARAAAALERFTPGPGRGEQRRIANGQVLLLDESYNASSASVRAALAVLARLPAHRRLAVLGDMLELGTFAEQEHAGLAPDVAQAADLLYACGPLTRCLFDQVPPSHRGAHTGSAETLAPLVAAAVRPGDAVLVKGSLGSRVRLVVQALETPKEKMAGDAP